MGRYNTEDERQYKNKKSGFHFLCELNGLRLMLGNHLIKYMAGCFLIIQILRDYKYNPEVCQTSFLWSVKETTD